MFLARKKKYLDTPYYKKALRLPDTPRDFGGPSPLNGLASSSTQWRGISYANFVIELARSQPEAKELEEADDWYVKYYSKKQQPIAILDCLSRCHVI